MANAPKCESRASGTITATSSCPVIASSNQSWVTATPLGSSVAYTVAPNNTGSQRSATLTIGTIAIPITQNVYSACDLKQTGSVTVADVQLIINEALGVASAVNFLAGNSTVSVVDVQIEINAALGLGCASK